MVRDRLQQPLATLVDSLREEFPQLLAVYRFGGFGTGYAGRPLPAVKLWRMAQERRASSKMSRAGVAFMADELVLDKTVASATLREGTPRLLG